MGKYEYVINKLHPRANKDGQVYKHIIVAEQKIGRYLLPEEVVHHKDFDKSNNHPDNLMIFATKGDHTRFHHYNCDENILKMNDNGVYFCDAIPIKCIDCGALITKGSVRCVSCANKHQQKVHRPNVDELYKLLVALQGNFTKIGTQYGVTDNTVRKWCDSYGLPRHSKEYKTFN